MRAALGRVQPEVVVSANVIEVDSETWNSEVAQSRIPVLVDFWAPRCGPFFNPRRAVEAFASEYAGSAKVLRLNRDRKGTIAAEIEGHLA